MVRCVHDMKQTLQSVRWSHHLGATMNPAGQPAPRGLNQAAPFGLLSGDY
jgi:hypothetical protein